MAKHEAVKKDAEKPAAEPVEEPAQVTDVFSASAIPDSELTVWADPYAFADESPQAAISPGPSAEERAELNRQRLSGEL